MQFFLSFDISRSPREDPVWKGRRCTRACVIGFFLLIFAVPLNCGRGKVILTEVVQKRPVDAIVKSNPLVVQSLERKLEEGRYWKESEVETTGYKILEAMGRNETNERITAETLNKSAVSTPAKEAEVLTSSTSSTLETVLIPSSTSRIDNSIIEETVESNEIGRDDEEASTSKEEDVKLDMEDQEEMDISSGSSEEEPLPSLPQEAARPRFSTSPTVPTSTTPISAPPSPTSKPSLKSVRTTYPFLKKVPARLVAKLKTTTSKPKKIAPKVKGNIKTPRPRPATPMPQEEPLHNPHHPHGIVVFDKRKRRPKPGRPTTPTTTTPETPTTVLVVTDEDGLNPDNATTPSNVPHKTTKIPLSKLAIAMISSSTNFDNGSNSEGMIHYQKTPVNLLYLLQAYTKQLQLANSGKPVVNTLDQPIRIQSTPFMLQLNQLNYAAKLGISVYYSLIAIIPLIYLAFGGLGRMGFLSGFVGKKRRRKRSLGFKFDHDYFRNGEGYKERDDEDFRRKSHFKNYMGTGSNFNLNRSDLRGEEENGNEEQYAWILGKISEIILEFSMLTPEENETNEPKS